MSVPNVLISYSHDSIDHSCNVLHLANCLRRDGVCCDIDQFSPYPTDGWPKWMERKIQGSDFVILVITEQYAERWNSASDNQSGLGVAWESEFIRNDLYCNRNVNSKYIPVFFHETDKPHLMLVLSGVTNHLLGDFGLQSSSYESLYRRLTSQPSVERSDLGELVVLPKMKSLPVETPLPEIHSETVSPTQRDSQLKGRLAHLRSKLSTSNDSNEQQTLRKQIQENKRGMSFSLDFLSTALGCSFSVAATVSICLAVACWVNWELVQRLPVLSPEKQPPRLVIEDEKLSQPLVVPESQPEAFVIVDDEPDVNPKVPVIDERRENKREDLIADDTPRKAHSLDRAIDLAYEGLRKMRSSVQDYTAVMVKRERVDGLVSDPEYMKIKVRSPRDEIASVPFSVYMKHLRPRASAGREAIWVEGKNQNRLCVHEGRGLMSMREFNLDPTGWVAMKGNRYPIYDAGIENLIVKLIEKAERDRDAGPATVTYREGAMINKRSCVMIEIVHEEKRAPYEFYKAQIFFDDELGIPVRYAAYDWPASPGASPALMEEYTYVNIQTNVGLTDSDFDPSNPAYHYPNR